jgi:DNA-binding NtrC family response regulator
MPDPDSPVVLVVDSETSTLKNVSSTLRKAGFTVLTAHGASAVLDFVDRHRDPVDLAIVDTAISGNSPEVMVRLYGSYPDVRILFTSTQGDPAGVVPIVRPGRVRAFLQKPFRRSQLLGHVLEVLDTPIARTA